MPLIQPASGLIAETDDSPVALSTQQAAMLLDVHESSVKRWCNSSLLPCSSTAGGHRRITLAALMAFSRERELDCDLAWFAPDEQVVWSALCAAREQDDYSVLSELLYASLDTQQNVRTDRIIRIVLGMGFPVVRLCDSLIASVLGRIGTGWKSGTVTVGDEHRMTEAIRDSLYGLIGDKHDAKPDAKTAIVACGRTDAHDLGALMVRLTLLYQGWRVVYLGQRVPSEDLVLQQQRTNATLICVSFSPPQDVPDAMSLARTLGGTYDTAAPYRLAIGGSGVQNADPSLLSEVFPGEAAFFRSLESFAAWAGDGVGAMTGG